MDIQYNMATITTLFTETQIFIEQIISALTIDLEKQVQAMDATYMPCKPTVHHNNRHM